MKHRSIKCPSDPTLECDPGPAPMLQWIEIEALCVDETYQRDLSPKNWKAIRAIARNFRWSRFSPVFVAPVEGGKFAIIDGQHRTHAAQLCGLTAVPCQVVQMTHAEQAEAFAAVNGMVTAITTWNLFRAELASGDEEAVALQAAVEAAGCRIATSNANARDKKPGTIYFIQGAKTLFKTYGPLLTRSLRVILAAEPFNENAELWNGATMRPMLEALCQCGDETLDRPDLPAHIEEFDIYQAMDGIEEERKRRMRAGLLVRSNMELIREKFLDHLTSWKGGGA